MRATALTLGVAAAGAAAAWALGVPAPFLTGPALVVSVAAVAGLPATIPDRLRDGVFIVVGTGMGTGITPEAVATASQWPISLVILAAGLCAILFLGTRLLTALFQFDRPTAFLAATPGHLSFVLGLSSELPVDLRQIAIVQSLRVLSLTLLVPLVVSLLSGSRMVMVADGREVMGLPQLTAILVLAGIAGHLLKRLQVPAAFLLAGMAISGVGHLTELTTGIVPPWLAIPAFTTMGALIGSRFTGVTIAQLGHAAGAAAVLTAFAILVSLAGAAATSWAFGVPIVTALIAFAPGGVETMAAMSVMLDADPAFVATHHIFRIVLLSFLVPIFLPRPATGGPP